MTQGRSAEKFGELRARNEAALIPCIMSGDPTMETTARLGLELEARGADIVELGVPFSDPMADGPTNQRAGARGLKAGATLPAVLSLVAGLRHPTVSPCVPVGYCKPILRYA